MTRSAAARNTSPVTAPTRRGAGAPAVKPMQQAVLYARVSSRDQEKEGFSIPAQQKLLRTYAEEKGIRIVAEFTDIETAKKVGRLNFGKMLAWMKANPACRVILVEKTDRLYRNIKDWVALDDMDVEIHLVKEGTVLSDTSRSSEKFIHGIKVLMAKNYIDNLSEEVRKGMQEKADQGIFPGAAPLGYLNVTGENGKRVLGLDPERAPIVKRLFELYSTGRASLEDLAKESRKLGLKSKKAGNPLGPNVMHIMLHNPLYKGEYYWQGKWYQGSHTPLVTPELWARVQDIMGGRGTAGPLSQKHQFAFNGIVTCGVCADEGARRLLVGEIQKEKYIYYHCAGCQRAGRKPPFISEAKLSAMFDPHLERMHLDGGVREWLKTALRSSHEDEKRFHREATDRLQKQYAALQRKVDIAYDDRLEGRITLERYEERSNTWREEMAHIRNELARHEKADRAYTEEGIALLELAGMALELYHSQDPSQRRRLLDFLCLNSEFRGNHVVVAFKKPFDELAGFIEGANQEGPAFDESGKARPVWWALLDLNQ